MSEKIFNTRIQHKHDIEANWLKATNFVPKAGELIVYDPDENFNYARTKMGDGTTNVNNLSFMNDVFWAVADVTSPYAIYEAHQLGKQCYAIRNSALSSGDPLYEIYKLEHIAIQQEMPIAYFSHRSGRIMDWCSVTPTGNPERGYWDFSSDTYASTKNLVKTIDETSTDSTFPSTKAVYDFMVENHTWESLPDKPFGEENIQHTIEFNEVIGDDFPLTCVYTVDGENKTYEVNEDNSYGPNHNFKVYEPLSKEEISSMVISLGEVDTPLTDSDIIIENENCIISEIFINILIDNYTLELGNEEYLFPEKGFYVNHSLFGVSAKFTWHEVSIVQIDSKYIKDDIARVSQIPQIAPISNEKIDEICGSSIESASEVIF